MFSISNFFRRAKRKIFRDTARICQNIYQEEFYGDSVGKDDVMLNIGAGFWHYKGWTNLDYPTQWYSSVQKHTFIAYDIRNDKIPFDSDTVKAVYCSHVIEHIENRFIQHFFEDVHRVLKPGGVFRIACPDAEFLYEVSCFDNEYWHWRRDWQKLFVSDSVSPDQIDWFVREIATPKMHGYIYSSGADKEDYTEKFRSMSMEEFFDYMTSDIEYRKDFPGDHINWWTFGKARDMLKKAGFKMVIRSKYLGSICRAMCNPAKFDTTCPSMSLYVEALK